METSLGGHIVAKRRAKHMTLCVLAEKLEVSAALLSMIERRNHIPKSELIVRLAKVLDGDADYWCSLAGRVTPAAEKTFAELAREDPETYRFFRTLAGRERQGGR